MGLVDLLNGHIPFDIDKSELRKELGNIELKYEYDCVFQSEINCLEKKKLNLTNDRVFKEYIEEEIRTGF